MRRPQFWHRFDAFIKTLSIGAVPRNAIVTAVSNGFRAAFMVGFLGMPVAYAQTQALAP